MPNTLIHIAVQAPATRAVFPKAELPWIFAGAILPDIPWIFQRIVSQTNLFDPYQARLYFTAQASLFFCLLLALSLSMLTRQPARIFLILAANCLFHLLLDALQIKWGNGVHLLAPLSWQYTHFNLVWPEHVLGYILSLLGIAYLFWKVPQINSNHLRLHDSPKWKIALLAFTFYLVLPVPFLGHLEQSDPSYTKTLRNNSTRAGKNIELDRSYYSAEDKSISLFTGEKLSVSGVLPENSGTISVQGKFISERQLQSYKYHNHNNYRDYASKAGLALVAGMWLYLLLQKRLHHTRSRIKS